MSLEKIKKAKAAGQTLDQFVAEELGNMPGSEGGLGVLNTQSRGGVDGGAGGHEGQVLQLPWSHKIIDLLCRKQDGVRTGTTKGPDWAQLVCSDVRGDYLVGISVRRLSETYQGWDPAKNETAEDRHPIKTCDNGGDKELPRQFKGATDADALESFCKHLNGRPIKIIGVRTIKREMSMGDGTTRVIDQKVWDYTLVDEVPQNTIIWALENWDSLSVEDKTAAAEVLNEAGIDTPKTDDKGKKN